MKVYDFGLLLILFLLFAGSASSHDHHHDGVTAANEKPMTPEQFNALMRTLADSPLMAIGLILSPLGVMSILYIRSGFTLSATISVILSGILVMEGYRWALVPMAIMLVGLIVYFWLFDKKEKNVIKTG